VPASLVTVLSVFDDADNLVLTRLPVRPEKIDVFAERLIEDGKLAGESLVDDGHVG
jgi:hypothetical protein